MPGQIFGDRYEVERTLGRKSGRWTLLARDLHTKEPVILKLLSIDSELKPRDLTLFEREVATLQSIDHPATPRYLGYFEMPLFDGKAIALVQTFVEGKSLAESIAAGELLNESQAIDLAEAVLEILSYLHQHQPPIVHRDIKPSNILRTEAGSVKLVDFGTVRSLQPNEQRVSSFVGTEGYTSPEQNSGRATKASDLYGLGVTLIVAMTGIEPSQLPRHKMRIDFTPVLSLSPHFSQWLEQMIQPDLDRRFASVQAALAALKST
ncbi:serine/threonine protein kinase [Microcoleus sp. FACHB-1515]|uniref:serine/threonine protein kinase n=1 Tax=Cyanophyceae TaxID=3028117 RepID=UPI0016860C72|nr:serine/threonine-protein kinase [Microcoleus sp. FACHB-1515]MBD2091262.1 serine/threonine protein kinase [Microcoleus sp. FACHB-1515]